MAESAPSKQKKSTFDELSPNKTSKKKISKKKSLKKNPSKAKLSKTKKKPSRRKLKLLEKKKVTPNKTKIEMVTSKTGSVLSEEKMIQNKHIIDETLSKYSILVSLEQKTGISKVFLAAGCIVISILVLVSGFSFQILVHMISLVWPCYRSFLIIDALEQLESKNEEAHLNKKDQWIIYKQLRIQLNMPPAEENYEDLGSEVDSRLEEQKKKLLERCHGKITRYLIYWVVYGLFYFIEYVLQVLTWWIPFYWVIKLTFLYWLAHHRYQGSVYVYRNLFAPFMQKRQTHINGWIETAKTITQATIAEIKGDGLTVLTKKSGNILTAGLTYMTQIKQMKAEHETKKQA